MTEDYKEQLIDYVTNLLNIQQPQPKDVNIVEQNYLILENNEDWANVITELKSYGIPYIFGELKNEKYDATILYGAIYSSEENGGYTVDYDRGFLIYIDNNNNPIKVITKYSSGSDLKGFHKLYFDEESNRVYGVIGHPTNGRNNTDPNYFAMFNNMFTNDEIKLLASYNISQNTYICTAIEKDPNGANYLMIGANPISLYNINIIELKINVGSANEWNRWNVNEGRDITHWLLGYYAKYENNTPYFKIFTNRDAYSQGNQTINIGIVTNNGNSLNYQTSISADRIVSFWKEMKCEYKSENEVYFSQTCDVPIYKNNQLVGHEYFANLYKYDGNNVILLYQTEKNIENHYVTLNVIKIEKDIYSNITFFMFLNNRTYIKTDVYISKDTSSPIEWTKLRTIDYQGSYDLEYMSVTTSQNYNLIKYNMITGRFIQYPLSNYIGYFLKEINPVNGYNGDPYVSYNLLKSSYTNLYSNGSLIFSRNLYNISKQNNMTMSSVEIPNTYLNDTTITTNDLISETNFKMNSDNTQWTKNIYEVVDLNFLNTISVIDEDTDTSYIQSAIKINDAITDGTLTDYQNTPCTKYRINYTDTTTSVDNIAWTNIDDTHKETEITIYVDKAITSIDFISSDESTIYLTIPLQVDVGKYYTINQKIKIE